MGVCPRYNAWAPGIPGIPKPEVNPNQIQAWPGIGIARLCNMTIEAIYWSEAFEMITQIPE